MVKSWYTTKHNSYPFYIILCLLLFFAKPGCAQNSTVHSLNSNYEKATKSPHSSTNYHECRDEQTFSNLTSCMESCNRTVAPEDNDVVNAKVNKRAYKLIILKENYFLTSNDGKFLTTNQTKPTTFNSSVFWIVDRKAYLCYKMPPTIRNCTKSLIPSNYRRDPDKHQIWATKEKKFYPVWDYFICLDHKTCRNDTKFIGFAYYCRASNPISKIHTDARLVGWSISIACISLTIILSQLVPKLKIQKNVILLFNLITLLAVYIIMCIKIQKKNPLPATCRLLSHFLQYVWLSSFCWINVQAIDVFLRFSRLRVEQSDSRQKRKRFILYSIHAWLTPFWITIITVIAEDYAPEHINPRIKTQCWITRSWGGFPFFYGPVALILLVNLTLFAITVFKLCTIGKRSTAAKPEDKKQFFQVYLKLIIVMGLCWFLEVLSIVVGGHPDYWLPTDIINSLQGLWIFIVYVCKPAFFRKVFRCKTSQANHNPNTAENHDEADTTSTRSTLTQPSPVERNAIV